MNSFDITSVAYPATYILSITSTSVNLNGVAAPAYPRALVYVTIPPDGTLLQTNLVTSYGCSINSYNTTTRVLNISIGISGQSINIGGFAWANLLRLS